MEIMQLIDKNSHSFQKDFDLKIFSDTREQAYRNLKRLGFPTRKTETYKYTNLKNSFETNKNFSYLEDSNLETQSYAKNGFINLFCVNGKFIGNIDGLKVSRLNAESLKVISQNRKALKDDFLYQLNESTINIGHHLEFEKNFTSKSPILIHHILDTKHSGIYNFHNTFSVKTGAKVELTECYHTHAQVPVLCNFASSIVLCENSKFIHLHHQDFNHDSTFVNNIRAQVSANASYESFTMTLGSLLTRNNIHIDLNAEGAKCMAHGVYTLQNNQHSDINSFIDHKAPHTESSQLYKGIMADKSRGVFTGLIKVVRDAQLINSNQLNKNLLLSKGAHANSRPQLEIFADDVKCSHGSTTGQLNEDELFYFQSRGISPEKAKMMLSHAYTYDVLLKIENLVIRNFINTDIIEKFEKAAFEAKNV